MSTEITETRTEICNICGSDGHEPNKKLQINPGYSSRLICHACYCRIEWTVLGGLRRLGIFGTLDEPRKIQRVWSDEYCVQNLMDTLVKMIREKDLNIHIDIGRQNEAEA